MKKKDKKHRYKSPLTAPVETIILKAPNQKANPELTTRLVRTHYIQLSIVL